MIDELVSAGSIANGHPVSLYCGLRNERSSIGPRPEARMSEVTDRPETVLEMARRHVLEGEERLARQIGIVANLGRDNHTEAATLARKVLGTIRFSLDMWKRHLTHLERRSKR